MPSTNARPQDPADTARLNVSLVPDAVAALSKVQMRSGMKKVDITNRALTLYEFIEAELRAGNTIIVRDPAGCDQRIAIM